MPGLSHGAPFFPSSEPVFGARYFLPYGSFEFVSFFKADFFLVLFVHVLPSLSHIFALPVSRTSMPSLLSLQWIEVEISRCAFHDSAFLFVLDSRSPHA